MWILGLKGLRLSCYDVKYMKQFIELRLYMKVENDHRSKFSNLSNWKGRSLKKNQGFNGIRTHDLRVAGALLYQLSYEATHWERGQFIEFISPVRSEMM